MDFVLTFFGLIVSLVVYYLQDQKIKGFGEGEKKKMKKREESLASIKQGFYLYKMGYYK